MIRRRLTDRQQETLNAIVAYIAEKGYPPTVRDVADAIGAESVSTAHAHMRRLVAKGYLQIDGSPRALRVVES